MKPFPLFLTSALATFMATQSFAGAIEIVDGYARSASPMAKSGAAFMEISNVGDVDDRLVAVVTESALRTELHTHLMENGVAQMRPIEGGIALPAGSSHSLQRGGDHIMMMGLTHAFEQGGAVELTLIFEVAGEISVTIPVDLERAP